MVSEIGRVQAGRSVAIMSVQILMPAELVHVTRRALQEMRDDYMRRAATWTSSAERYEQAGWTERAAQARQVAETRKADAQRFADAIAALPADYRGGYSAAHCAGWGAKS